MPNTELIYFNNIYKQFSYLFLNRYNGETDVIVILCFIKALLMLNFNSK